MGYEQQEADAHSRALEQGRDGMSIAEQHAAGMEQHRLDQRAWDARSRYGYSAPSMPSLSGPLWLVAVFVVVGLMLLVVLLFAALWMAVHDPLRALLEISPLSGAVAEGPKDDSSPFLVAAVTGGLVLACLVAVSSWRRRVVERVLRGEAPARSAFLASLARALVIFAGVGLVVVCGGIAAGADLPGGIDFPVKPPDASTTSSGSLKSGLIPIGLALLVLGLFTWLSTGRAFQKAEATAPRA